MENGWCRVIEVILLLHGSIFDFYRNGIRTIYVGVQTTTLMIIILTQQFRAFSPPGAIQSNQTNHTFPLYTATAQQKVLVVWQPSSTSKAPSTDERTDNRPTACGSLRCVVMKRRQQGRPRRHLLLHLLRSGTARASPSHVPSVLC